MLKALLAEKAEIEGRMALLNEELQQRMAPLNDEMATVMEQIRVATADKLAQLRTLQAKEYGVVHLNMDGVKVSETVAKKVDWNQEKLNEIFDRIATAGDDPRAYVKMKLEVPEKQYEKFAPGVQSIFAEARTVTPGKPSYKFEEVAA